MANRGEGAPSSTTALELYRLPAERLRQLSLLALELAEATLDLPRLIETVEHRFAELAQGVCELSFPRPEKPGSSVAPISEGGSLTLPLVCRDRVIAHLRLNRSSSEPYNDDELAFLRAAAAHAAITLANARAFNLESDARGAAEEGVQSHRDAKIMLDQLSASGMVGISVNELTGSVVDINDTLLRIIGYTRAEVLSRGIDWSALTPPEYAEIDALALRQLRSGGKVSLREKEYLRRDGSRVPVLIGSAMIAGETETAISFVLDLSGQKKAEAEAEHMRAVAEAQAKLGAIVMASDDAIIGSDLAGVITSFNPGAERMFGYGVLEVRNRALDVIVPADRLDELDEKLRAVAAGEVQRFETVRRRRDGSTFDVSVVLSPVRDASGTVVSIAKVARDITEQRLAAARTLRAVESAERANAELEAFSYSVAHDLRAPLRGMNGFSRLLLERYSSQFDEEGRDWLQEILENSQKMGLLIDALLSLARVSRSEIRRELVDLSQLAQNIAGELGRSEPERRVTWQLEPNVAAQLDSTLARVLLENLLGNAWKFTSKTSEPRIELGLERAPGGRTFFVRDNGAGFDMAYANKLFGPFQRLHSSSDFQGTGIGLATVQRVVHRHGGRVWAEGIVHGGATFYFFLPDVTL